MTDFFRFTHTPHLASLSDDAPREDKLLSEDDRTRLLDGPVTVEEKVDGANIGFSVDDGLTLRVQNRGAWLDESACPPQFRPLWPWLRPRSEALLEALWPNLMLFGEWCAFVHSVRYVALPDWFLGFDLYDREAERFVDPTGRDALLDAVGLHGVPRLAEGVLGLPELESLLGRSRLGSEPMEGLVVRRSKGGFTEARAKLVRPTFVQAIDEHWSRGVPERNALDRSGRTPFASLEA